MTRNTDTPRHDTLMELMAMTIPAAGNVPRDLMEVLYPAGGENSELLVACSPDDFSASKLARAVEDCDVHLVNMNVTSARTPASELVVAMRIACANPRPVVHSLERYGFRVLSCSGSDVADANDVTRRRAAELLHLLDI